MTKVLVTGGAGFIGSTLTRHLLNRGYKVTVLDNLSTGWRQNLPEHKDLKLVSGDVRDFELVHTVTPGHSHVIHLAAQAFIPLGYQLPVQVAETNALGSLNVFKASLNSGVKRLVHISSSEVYGSARYIPMDEKHPLCPCSTYAVGKAAADQWAQTFSFEHKLPVVILRPFNTFGPRETLPRFINEVIRQCLKEPVINVGNLETSRDFTYVEDCASAIIAALETEGIEDEIINIGTNRAWKMREVLDMIKKYLKTEEKEVVTDYSRIRPKEVTYLVTSNTKAGKLLGWKPTIDFSKGLAKTIEWYLNNGMSWGYERQVIVTKEATKLSDET